MKTVTVTTSQTEIVAPADMLNADFIHINNPTGGQSVFVKYDGDATAVTTANGMELQSGEWLVLNNDGPRNIFAGKGIYGIVSATTQVVRVQGAS